MENGDKSINELYREGMDYGPVRREAVLVVAALYLAEKEALSTERRNDAQELALHKIRRARLMDMGMLKLDENLEMDSPMARLWDNYIHSTSAATSIETAAMMAAFGCKPSPPSLEEKQVIWLESLLLLEDPRKN